MKQYIMYTLLLFSLGGCKKFVEVGTPVDRLVTGSVFKSNETANAVMIGLYANMMEQNFLLPYTIATTTGQYADELDYKLTDVTGLTLYRNALQAKDAPTNNIWTKGYKYIYQANSILKGLEKATGVTAAVAKQLTGEALFIRAFWHFYLCNLYGDIPLATATDYSVNAAIARTPVSKVYDQVVADLVKAKSLLSPEYVAANSIDASADRVRPNAAAASALLARVYLYRQNWQMAEAEAGEVINDPVYTLENIADVFKTQSREAIWQLQMPTPEKYCTYEAFYFVLTAKPSGVRKTAISASLLSQFAPNDLRRMNWIGVFTDTTTTPHTDYFYPYKYKTTGNAIIDERSIVLRFAEMYLIRAEARAQQDERAGAIEDVDAIRQRAGIALIKDIQPDIAKEALLDTIMNERQRELFCEWGHRWLDLKRTGRADAVMSVVTPQKGGVWSPDWLLWPIPKTDIDNSNNKKLIQNEGYDY